MSDTSNVGVQTPFFLNPFFCPPPMSGGLDCSVDFTPMQLQLQIIRIINNLFKDMVVKDSSSLILQALPYTCILCILTSVYFSA